MDVLDALDRGESVTLLYRGREKGTIHPAREMRRRYRSIKDHPAFGMWKDREDMKDVQDFLGRLRGRGRLKEDR